ncbi:MAG TPA: hypothetical protein EYP14_02015, partial [Planctomycetaceae bacterium]|nr:hypothetical protein [Planctomycetaceae bacterium]
MNGRARNAAVVLALTAATAWAAEGEKVFFRDELTGIEMWRLSREMMFHEYPHAAKPFSYDGRYVVCRQWRPDGGVVVIKLADGSRTVFRSDRKGWVESPAFLRGQQAVVYCIGRQDATVYLVDLISGREQTCVPLHGKVQLTSAGVVGPRSEFLLLRGDMTGDGLADLGL